MNIPRMLSLKIKSVWCRKTKNANQHGCEGNFYSEPRVLQKFCIHFNNLSTRILNAIKVESIREFLTFYKYKFQPAEKMKQKCHQQL